MQSGHDYLQTLEPQNNFIFIMTNNLIAFLGMNICLFY